MIPLIVISVDALVTEDLQQARNCPTFGKLLKKAAIIPKVRSIFPTLTYPCHVTQLTGNTIDCHGVTNNEKFDLSTDSPDWIWNYDAIQSETLLDVARRAGLKTAAFMWPVTANAPVDYLVPEVWVKSGKSDAFDVLSAHSSEIMAQIYLKKHLHHLEWNNQPLFDDFGVALAEDVLANENIDLLFLHLSCVDISRHQTGLFSDRVDESILQIDGYLQRIVDRLERKHGPDGYHLIIVSDHGHMKVHRQLNLNVDFTDCGLYRRDDQNYGAYVSGAGLAAYVTFSDTSDEDLKKRVEQKLYHYVSTPEYGIQHIYTAKECLALFQLDGDFSYCLISDSGTSFKNVTTGRVLRIHGDDDFEYATTGHGHHPDLGIQPVFIGIGPQFVKGLHIITANLQDEAPTFASLLGLSLPSANRSILTELLRKQG